MMGSFFVCYLLVTVYRRLEGFLLCQRSRWNSSRLRLGPLSAGKNVTDVPLARSLSATYSSLVMWMRTQIVDGRGDRSSEKVFFGVMELCQRLFVSLFYLCAQND